MFKESSIREPLILGDTMSYHQITEDIVRPIEGKANKMWWIAFTISVIAALWGVSCFAYTVGVGIGAWGLNKTVGWAWDITNFVWWIGIGHAGTLISAVLLLFRQRWRMAINRSAEAMTIFGVICAALFPVFHMGRVWMAYWVMPIPNQFGSLWVNFNSPLLWDVFAVTTYFTVSVVFWYLGLIPDFAMIRDRAKVAGNKMNEMIYRILSFGWSGRVKDWVRFEEVSLVLAGLATPLVFSVHSIVSMDFATSLVPGWHSTIFPPYFVAGAIFSGFAMVLTLVLIMRKMLHIEHYVTVQHVEYMTIVVMLTGSLVGIAYLTEIFMSWYCGVIYESYCYISRITGPYWWAWGSMITCNVVAPQVFWFKKIRRNLVAVFIMSIIVNIGMWFERFTIIVISLHWDFLPSSWVMYHPTWVEVGIFIGTIGFFFTCFLIFARVFPVIAQSELKTIMKISSKFYKDKKDKNDNHHH